jgi:aspartyl-tRNA(Asn)/glutamyl-tRNA(Gln) amidotransferase subunit A
MTTELSLLTAHALNQAFTHHQLSPVEATQAVLKRSHALNPIINAFCLIDDERALAAAKASEARWKNGAPLSALDGIPVSIKDLILTKGWPTLRGSKTIDPHQAWDVDAPCVARLKDSGAVIFGKTTTPEYGCKGETNSLLTGLTHNPWKLSKTPGGSSGGTAAAIAAGCGPLSIGTDGAGSVRIPAAFCGNFGLKPSFGRVPAFPQSPFGTVAHLGPHSMSVTDAAMLMNIISQPDARDWSSLPYQPIDYTLDLSAGIRGWRIAYSPTLGYVDHCDPEILQACDQAVARLQGLGASVKRIDPGFDSPLDISVGLWFLGSQTIWQNLTAAQREQTDPDFRAQAAQGAAYSALDIAKLNARRGQLGSHMRQFMQDYDLLVTPTVAVTAFDSRQPGSSPFDGEQFLAWTPYSYPFNLTQQPAATIPCGLSRDGLPIGLQLVGNMFADASVLRAARAFESVFPIIRPAL